MPVCQAYGTGDIDISPLVVLPLIGCGVIHIFSPVKENAKSASRNDELHRGPMPHPAKMKELKFQPVACKIQCRRIVIFGTPYIGVS